MKNENSAVKAGSTGSLLAVNLILMVLSCVLFVGTTLAWFTDQTSGGINRIQAGNLEAELCIGETGARTVLKLDPPSGAQPVNAGTAVSLQLRKLVTGGVAEEAGTGEVWNPDDIFISDVMQVKKASGSVPFEYKLELLIDPAEDPAEQSAETMPLKASELIDFRIVDVSEISTVSNDERTYNYDAIGKYFGEALENADSDETPPVPIWLLADEENNDSGQTQPPTNVFSSENETIQFVILAKLKHDVSVGAELTTIENPFNLIVTLKQTDAEFESAAEAGDVS